MIHRRTQERNEFFPTDPAADGSRALVTSLNTRPFPQAYKDVSSDQRKGLSSFFAYGKRSAERDAFQQAHMTPAGVPGVLNLAVVDPDGNAIPFAPFNWNGRQMLTDARGMIKYVDKDYFQTAISMEN